MGSRGPVPKREDQRRRVNKPEVPVVHAPSGAPAGTAYRRPAAQADWHPLARRWWNALAKSGQSRWYEPSDWEHAYVWADLLSRQLKSGKPSAMMLAAWDSASSRLLVTEGDRRRVRIELERAGQADEDADKAGVTAMDEWRNRLAGQASDPDRARGPARDPPRGHPATNARVRGDQMGVDVPAAPGRPARRAAMAVRGVTGAFPAALVRAV